ncbi:MAG: glutathione S-transferase family protein [Gammaproteobacteria bacterium]|nr:glutathione S-transferase family protein [Gammaproteobacteria bacterium]
MILIGNYDSPFVRRVAVALHHYGLPFQRKVISVFRDFDEMLEMNPLGKVPALVIHEGEILTDSRIILDYLEGLVGDHRHLVPTEKIERRAVLRIEAIALGLAETSVELRIELYRKNPAAHDPDWISRLQRQLGSALAWLENSRPSPWFHDTGFSLPDITTVVAYTYLKHKLPEIVPAQKYTHLEQLWERCEALDAFSSAPYSKTEAQASEF